MRELKFRVWSEKQKTYNYKFPYNNLGQFYVSEHGKVFSDFGNTVAPEVRQEAFVVEQCTGLKDNDGKEIYEGDVVWWEHYNGMNGKICEHKAEVYYDEKLGGYFVSYADTSLSELIMEEEVYINTNIHENKELLDE